MSDQQSSPAGENPPFIELNPDGSYTRHVSYPSSVPTPDEDSNTPVLSKDLTINHINKTYARIHIPKETLTRTPAQKLPLVVYFHGGGFVILSAATTITHNLCDQLAAHLPAVVVNVDYRLAPEHRLPAAYDDANEALHWIKTSEDPWLTGFADLSNCYLMGTSAGANMAYHVGLRVSRQLQDLDPLKIKGLILHNMFIGGLERTESDIRLADGLYFTLSMSDTMWDLCLPIGANRDHEYCNPIVGSGPDNMGRIKDVGWQVMLACGYGDLMIDRQMELAKILETKGVKVKCFYGDGAHGAELFDESKAKKLFEEISSFVSSINQCSGKVIDSSLIKETTEMIPYPTRS